MKIALVRHGQTSWNLERRFQGRTDIPLNDTGREQAQSAARLLSADKADWKHVFSSPLLRAYETAEIIAKELNIRDVVADDDLVERCYGAAEGQLYDGVQWPPAEAETHEAVRARVMPAIMRCAEAAYPDDCIIVAHGGVINAILAVLSNDEIGTGKTKLANGSVSMVIYDGETLQLEDYNRTE